MKKKFNFELTIFLVGLFVSLLLMALGNKSVYCLSFGVILLGIVLCFYANMKMQRINQIIKELENELQEVDFEDVYLIKEITKQQSKLKRQRVSLSITFYCVAIMLIVLGIINMI